MALWRVDTQDILARARVPAAASANTSIWGGWRFGAIEPLTLEPGTYVLGSQIYANSADRYLHDAEVDTAPGITWGEGRHANGSSLAYPTEVYAGPTS